MLKSIDFSNGEITLKNLVLGKKEEPGIVTVTLLRKQYSFEPTFFFVNENTR